MSSPPPTRTGSNLDVSRLPTIVFGSRDLTWWGTLGFIVIEAMTLAVGAASYFYLSRNFAAWPPLGTPLPDLALPTASAVLYAASVVPMVWLNRAAKRMDRGAVQRWLLVGCVLVLALTVLRAFEFGALNTRWDSNAYGSIVWTLLGFHATLLVIEVAEVLGITAVMFSDRVEEKHFTDASDVAFYWYFLAGAWIPLYAIVFILPRLM